MPVNIAVIDGMGGGIGSEVIALLKKEFGNNVNIIALGINAIATDKMMQAKANRGATGKNAIKCALSNVDFVLGPIGIIFPDGLMGEVTKKIAKIVTKSKAKKILIPVIHPNIKIVGLKNEPLASLIYSVIEELKKDIQENGLTADK